MTQSTFETEFTSDLFRAKQAVDAVLSFISDCIPFLSSEDYADLKLIFSELLYNAAIHGNNRDLNKMVRVWAEVKNDTVHARITDEGVGFDHLELLASFNKEANLGAGGRGIHLVYSLTDELAFNVRGNEITFYKRVKQIG